MLLKHVQFCQLVLFFVCFSELALFFVCFSELVLFFVHVCSLEQCSVRKRFTALLTLTEETPFPLLMHTPAVTEPVAPHHRRMAMTTSGTKVPSPPDEWLPPVVRRETTA